MLPGVELARRRRVHYHGDAGAPSASSSAGGAGEHHHHYAHRAAAGVAGPALAARIRLEEKLRAAALPPATTSPSRWSRLMGEREGRAAATAGRRNRREQAQPRQQAERGDLAPGAGAVLWPPPPAPTTPVTTMVAAPAASASSPVGNRRRAELTRTLSMVDVCAVCLEEVRERRQRVTRLPCSHKYHSECVLPWLAIHPDCPCCRALVPSVDALA